MAKQSKFKNGVKSFFKSIGQDIKSLFTKHWLKLVGYLISFVIPLVLLISLYLKQKPESWTFPLFVWVPIIILILIYWGKFRAYLSKGIAKMEIENSLQKGKHSGALILASIMQVIMTALPFVLCYYIFHALEQAMIKVEDLFIGLAVFELVGGVFIVLDVAINSVDTTGQTEQNNDSESN